jgi:NAD(P)-dependent dehydrogenase (short-subunit alcohol dehydrogenase family)
MAKKTAKKARKTSQKKATRTGEKMGTPPPQAQKQSGKEYEMTPRPESQAREYRAAGKLRDQVALITGGDSGIGRAVAVAFAKEGADVAIVFLSTRRDAEETRNLVQEQNRHCILIQGDVGDSAFCGEAVARTLDEFGRPGQPDEVAPCYVFLASDDSSYMTGQVLHPNGGKIVNG